MSAASPWNLAHILLGLATVEQADYIRFASPHEHRGRARSGRSRQSGVEAVGSPPSGLSFIVASTAVRLAIPGTYASERQDDLESPDSGLKGGTVLEAQCDGSVASHRRWVVSGIMLITVVGILLIPFWLLFSLWNYPEYLRRVSARLTTQALEIRKGVFFRTEATIPLNRITDVRLDGPVMLYCGLRGLKVKTARMSGDTGSEGNLIGVIDAIAFRDAVLAQRQEAVSAEQSSDSPEPVAESTEILAEIRDILARIEEQGRRCRRLTFLAAAAVELPHAGL